MKTGARTFALLLLLGLLGAGCSTVSQLSTEYEEEMTRIENLSPEEKAAFEEEKRLQETIEMKGYWEQSDND